MNLTGALDQAHYCIKCHNQGKDSCSTGLKEKDGDVQGDASSAITLAGLPARREDLRDEPGEAGRAIPIGALAIVTIDNPMVAGTGHRICNDCMKACVFQKQDPVDIPQVETRTLKDVLELPWGFEIYSLLTRWNPLNFARPVPRAATGYKVLVVGLGPAGFTLSHHLMNDGHTVAAVDGLKIEPLPEEISGVTPLGERVPFRPIRDVNEFIRIARRPRDGGLRRRGGVRHHGSLEQEFPEDHPAAAGARATNSACSAACASAARLTVDDAFELGFDHVALCAGAGRPTVIPMKNGLARGVRQASDFLMALQLTGAAKTEFAGESADCACRSS